MFQSSSYILRLVSPHRHGLVHTKSPTRGGTCSFTVSTSHFLTYFPFVFFLVFLWFWCEAGAGDGQSCSSLDQPSVKSEAFEMSVDEFQDRPTSLL